jgi:hypothetical protein
MREKVEFRVPEEYAAQFLGAGVGTPLAQPGFPPTIRKVTVATDDPLYRKVGDLYRDLRTRGSFFYHGWQIRRFYSPEELRSGELFHLMITAVFDPTGQECGTKYDVSSACSGCGAGRMLTSELKLDLRKAPKNKDIARTLSGDEWIVSQRLAELLVDHKVTGFELRPVLHKARYQDGSIRIDHYPSGRYLLQLAQEAGATEGTWEFYVWLNRPENRDLWELVKAEKASEGHAREHQRSYTPPPPWYQLNIKSPPISVVDPTVAGIKPFDEDSNGKYRCPLGDTVGLNVLSELWLDRSRWDGSDLARTEQYFGMKKGVFVPAAELLISPRLRELLGSEGIKGYRVEVAHLVDSRPRV